MAAAKTATPTVQNKMITVEEVMIAYGLSIAPAGIRATLERGVKENYTIRLKVIDAVFHLDVSTVKGKGVTA